MRCHIGRSCTTRPSASSIRLRGARLPSRDACRRQAGGPSSSCHPFGLTDNVVWIFPAGPAAPFPSTAIFDLADPLRAGMRVLQLVRQPRRAGGLRAQHPRRFGRPGLIVLDDGVTPDPNVNDFVPLANGNRNQLKVRGVGAWDAIKTYIRTAFEAHLSGKQE